jgi:hypothetical protein
VIRVVGVVIIVGVGVAVDVAVDIERGVRGKAHWWKIQLQSVSTGIDRTVSKESNEYDHDHDRSKSLKRAVATRF